MKQVFLFLVVITSLAAHAQSTRVQMLEQQLANHPQEDTFRVNRMTILARSFSVNTARRDSLATAALLLSTRLGYTEGEVNALIAKAQIKDNTQKVALVRQALAVANKSLNKIQISKALSALGAALQQTAEKKEALQYMMQSVEVAQSSGNKSAIASAKIAITEYYMITADYLKGLEWGLQAVHMAEQAGDLSNLSLAWGDLAGVYGGIGDTANALLYYKKALAAAKELDKLTLQIVYLTNLGELYRLSGHYQQALAYYNEASNLSQDPAFKEVLESNIADVYDRMGNYPLARQYAFAALAGATELEDEDTKAWIYGTLGRISLHTNHTDSALYYGNLGYNIAVQIGSVEFTRDNSQVLADAYARKKVFDKAYTFQNLYIRYRDSIFNADTKNKTSVLQYNADLQKKQAEIAVLNKDKQLQKAEVQRQRNFLLGALTALLLIAALLLVVFRNNRTKQKANILLQKQKKEIQDQRDQTNGALAELKAAQAQLVQSEKMASLGELTAGIAHEIQNPLNFVNNFSEVNRELIEEIKSQKSKLKSEELDELLDDIADNEEKINHHGRRADAIVKGMLQHSRASTGVKEPSDINALCDEYLRLSYHGLRAKDKDFNVTIKTDFDKSIGKIKIVSQDIGRALLNLFNNAFYAVNEKKKSSLLTPEGGRENTQYEPTVIVSTKPLKPPPAGGVGGLEITVKDNGNGIPQEVMDKIFQPFFTTKPTGQGTGLGLSLSYDVIKAHGGEIKVETKKGEGAAFIIQLPV